jgi:hypothetical protein|eukprot:COSAG01_NODE_5480_length_4231_cov_10.097484_1_plen_64_part_00
MDRVDVWEQGMAGPLFAPNRAADTNETYNVPYLTQLESTERGARPSVTARAQLIHDAAATSSS